MNIQELKEKKKYRVLHHLKKKSSPMRIEFLQEPKEDWFVEVVRFKRTTGEIKSHSIITQKQVNDWVERYQRIMKYETE